ncbi:1,4-dihydroxy-2-naphthoate polyprenyltransferase [Spirabiliibacterium falconis]|uniref:1,4-dihydroxy-2-naphthoate polyprenyltransferase n=1 Tax=Spirabiliibacterium falconis TaxID=572023 RepID=UPI001AAE1662|nr:1,4-dihydroxy-2-naphthoate polyprenyltransferase [Spirabiliibacterium falconis]MBE2894581.1 1,4-dihydroxy-2-naphthoate polyprenyltransferase [Spirabiliibacterium falconis]
MKKSQIAVWLSTARPKTLPLALASILTGTALGYADGHFNGAILFWSVMTALLLQVLSNFANDYGDHQKGSDTADRIGPLRGIQQGLINASQLKWGLITVAILACLSGLTLIIVACRTWQDLLAFVALGALAVLASITYTVGKKPYGYIGLGDISVLTFFGWIGVGGTYYLQTHYFIGPPIFLAATATGLLATAVLNINNLRDIEQDKLAGKNTLAVRLEMKNAKRYHAVLVMGALAIYVYLGLFYALALGMSMLLCLLASPLLLRHLRSVFRAKASEQLRPMLAQMSLLALLTNVLFSLGIVLSSVNGF